MRQSHVGAAGLVEIFKQSDLVSSDSENPLRQFRQTFSWQSILAQVSTLACCPLHRSSSARTPPRRSNRTHRRCPFGALGLVRALTEPAFRPSAACPVRTGPRWPASHFSRTGPRGAKLGQPEWTEWDRWLGLCLGCFPTWECFVGHCLGCFVVFRL